MRPLIVSTYNADTALWKLLYARTSASVEEFDAVFERRKLSTPIFDKKSMFTLHAQKIKRELEDSGRTVVVVGTILQRAFDLPPLIVHPRITGGVVWRQIPATLDGNMWYDTVENRKVVELLMEEWYVGYTRRLQTTG